VVFTSSREAYGEAGVVPVVEDHPLTAKNTYGASKVAGEAYCRTFTTVFGLETAVLRLANVYGPRDCDRVIPIWIERALRGEPLEVFGGTQVLDFVWVGLVVEALLRAVDADIVGTPVNVGSGTGTPILDLARRILTVTGSSSEVHVTPAREAEVVRFVAGVDRLHEHLGLAPDPDPLAHLADLVVTPAGRGA
jgi:UDP-glucose 4-epimerase